MKFIIPENIIGERLLPYVAKLNSIQVSEDMIYNMACMVLGYCIENNNFSDEYMFDRSGVVCWEVMGEVVMEVFSDINDLDKEYNKVEENITLCISAVYECCVLLRFYIFNNPSIGQTLINYFKTKNPMVHVENDNYNNVIFQFVDDREFMENNYSYAAGRPSI